MGKSSNSSSSSRAVGGFCWSCGAVVDEGGVVLVVGGWGGADILVFGRCDRVLVWECAKGDDVGGVD